MRVKQWRYFWGWFFLIALLHFIAVVLVIYAAPKLYESTAVFEATALYPGEDLTLPVLPDGIAVETLGPSLTKVTALAADPKAAVDGAYRFVADWFDSRRKAARSKIAAMQAAHEVDSPDWVAYEIQRRTAISVAGQVHVSGTWAVEPSKPDVDLLLGLGTGGSVLIALTMAGVLTRRRGQRQDDGVEIPWSRIGLRLAGLRS